MLPIVLMLPIVSGPGRKDHQELLDPEEVVFHAEPFDNASLPHKDALLEP